MLGVASYWDERKGLDVFKRLSDELPLEFEIIMVGVTSDVKKNLPKRIIAIERTNSQRELAGFYSIADVFLNPTIQDNFPTVNLESVACGTPVITYDTGGSPENSYTLNCIVDKGNYYELRETVISRRFENALNAPPEWTLSKICMAKKYINLFSAL